MNKILLASLASVGLFWLSAPRLAFWPAGLVALAPLAWVLATDRWRATRKNLLAVYVPSLAYWLVELQGLRHAHPWMFLGWVALAAYFACYLPLWVGLTSRLHHGLRAAGRPITGGEDAGQSPAGFGLPLGVSATLVWLALEWFRNYFLGGLSAGMLGHHVANAPVLIQIADLFGSYGVSCMLVLTGFAAVDLLRGVQQRRSDGQHQRFHSSAGRPWVGFAIGLIALLLTIGYGVVRLADAPDGVVEKSGAETTDGNTARVLLMGLNEPTLFGQTRQRDIEIFERYAVESIRSLRESTDAVDLIVWPESMFGGGQFVALTPEDAGVPDAFEGTRADLVRDAGLRNLYVRDRADALQGAASAVNQGKRPALWGGMGLVRYDEEPSQFSAAVIVDAGGKFLGWYGKRHRVMFGEYIPFINRIPIIRNWIPSNLGLASGYRPEPFQLAGRSFLPNICIETAVERIVVNDVGRLTREGKSIDAVVTIANDDWFDGTAVVDHHRRCAQLLAVAVRRPILSSANGGPTFWVDDYGRVARRLQRNESGGIVAEIGPADQQSLYTKTGTLPHGILSVATLMMTLRFRPKRLASAADETSLPASQ